MKSLSLKGKVYTLVSILITFCIITGISGYISSQKIAKSYGKIEEINLPSVSILLESLSDMRAAQNSLYQLSFPGQTPKEIQEITARHKKSIEYYIEGDKKYNENTFDASERELYESVKGDVDILNKDFAKALELHAKSSGQEGADLAAMRKILDEDVYDDTKTFQTDLFKLINWHRVDIKNNSQAAHASKKMGAIWMIISILSSIVFGSLISYFVMKNIMADQKNSEKLMEEAVRSYNLVEYSPNPTMMCDNDGNLIYLNIASIETLKKVESYLPDKVENLIGKSIDIFHKNPGMVRKIISDPKNLPHKAIINIGPEKAELLVSASKNSSGKYMGIAVAWHIVTNKHALVTDITKASDELSSAAIKMLDVSSNLNLAAEETYAQTTSASEASEYVNTGVQTVANSMEEMVSAIREITKTTNEASAMTTQAMVMAKDANNLINKLGDSSMDIGNVIKVISSIAQQTNLLALNATIEAARAGEAGKGFAVVANEVKELANQTSKATNEITKKIETIQSDSKNAVHAIGEINLAIEKLNGFTGNIAASVEQQAATTNNVTRIVDESASGVKQINENISQVASAAANTGRDAGNAQTAAVEVESTVKLLREYLVRLANDH